MPVALAVVVRVAMTLGPLALTKGYADKLGLNGLKRRASCWSGTFCSS
jgi:hypothetical protein